MRLLSSLTSASQAYALKAQDGEIWVSDFGNNEKCARFSISIIEAFVNVFYAKRKKIPVSEYGMWDVLQTKKEFFYGINDLTKP